MLLIDKLMLIFAVSSEILTQSPKLILTLFKIIIYSFSSNTVIDRAHHNKVAAANLIL